jgi:hypothetical protein
VAQNASSFPGEYAGTLGPYPVKLHLVAGSNGALQATVDSPSQNLFAVPCTDIHVNGAALTFSVPMVHGAWSGFLSGDGNSLSGMWNQGSTMPLNLTRVTTAQASSAAAPAQAQTHSSDTITWDDYTFKFNPTGTMAQVYKGETVVGTILTMNGQQQVLPLPGPEADKLKQSFADYQAFNARSHSASAAATTSSPTPPATTASATAASPDSAKAAAAEPLPDVHFDEASKVVTVPMPEGVTVTFNGNDIKVAGFHKRNFLIRHQKGSVGRFMESNVENTGRVGGSVSGGGEEFLYDPGGLIYDSGMGGYHMQENSQVVTAKQLSQLAVDAVARARQVPGHASFTPVGYNTLKEISQYHMRMDGSR